jgi:hypothetical protein
MTSLDEPEQPEETLYEPQILLGGMLDVFNSKFPDHKETLEMVNSIRRQIIDDPFAEIKLPADCDAAYFGSPVLLDLDLKLANPHLNVYQWIRNILTLKLYLRKNTLPSRTLKTLYLNLGAYEICDTYEYDCNSVEIYDCRPNERPDCRPNERPETSIDLNAKYKYLLDRYNDASALTETAVKNGHVEAFELLNVEYSGEILKTAIKYNQPKTCIKLYNLDAQKLAHSRNNSDIIELQNFELMDFAMTNKLIHLDAIYSYMSYAIDNKKLSFIRFLSKYVDKIPNSQMSRQSLIELFQSAQMDVIECLDASKIDLNDETIRVILRTKNIQLIKMFISRIKFHLMWSILDSRQMQIIDCFAEYPGFIKSLVEYTGKIDTQIFEHYKDEIREFIRNNLPISTLVMESLVNNIDLSTFKQVIPPECDLKIYPSLPVFAIQKPDFKMFTYLISLNLDINFDEGSVIGTAIQAQDKRFKNLLLSKNVDLMYRRTIISAAESDVELFKMIISKGIPVEQMDAHLSNEIMNHSIPDIKSFIDLSLPVNGQLLVDAITKNDPEFLQYLIDRGAIPDEDCDYDIVEQAIAEIDATKSLEFMINNNLYMEIDNETILIAGIEYDSRFLIDYAINQIPKDYIVESLENHLSGIDKLEHLKLFLNHGIDIHADDDQYLSNVIGDKNYEILEYLLDNFMFPEGLLQKLHRTTDCQKIKELIKPFIQEP